jgi:AcrR family transcriptional regulator
MSESKQAVVEEFRRESILRATQHVIASQGLAGASMQAIAEEAGVAKGTLYLYFKDRDDLLDQTKGHVFDGLLERLTAVLRKPRPLRDGLRALVRTKIGFFDANQEFLRVYMALRHGGSVAESRRRRREAPQYERYVRMLAAYLEAAMERGEMRRVDPHGAALFFVEGVSAFLMSRLDERGPHGTTDLDWAADMLADGLCNRRNS